MSRLSIRFSFFFVVGHFLFASTVVAQPGGMGMGGGGNSGGGGSGDLLGTDGSDNFCAARANSDEDEVIRGFGGMDSLCGFEGNDSLHGGEGDDLLEGGPGNDTLSPGSGEDTLDAGSGDDRILGATDGDTVDGGSGFDWASFNNDIQQIVVDFRPGENTIEDVRTGGIDSVVNVEKVTGTANDDIFRGGDDVGGSDSIDDIDEFFGGGRGDDEFYGGGGNDFIGGDRGNDLIVGGPHSDLLRGAEHNDSFVFNADDFTLSPGAGDVIEDFNIKADCIQLNPPLAVLGIDSSSNTGGGKKRDSVISVDADGVAGEDGTITAYDVSLSESDLGCPGP